MSAVRLRQDSAPVHLFLWEDWDKSGSSWIHTHQFPQNSPTKINKPAKNPHKISRRPRRCRVHANLRAELWSRTTLQMFVSLFLQQTVLLIMASGALFPSLVSGSRGSSSKYLVEFRAGKMTMKGSTVTPDKRKGQVYIQQTDDSLIHFCWKDRTTGNVDDDLIIFPDDCEFKRVNQCTTGRVYVLKFKAGSKRLFFWMQEPKNDKDDEYCRKVNEYLNNPPIPGALGSSGSGGHDLSALGGEGGLQSLLGNMSHNQLMQLIGPTGLGGIGGLGALAGPGLANLLGSSSSSSSSVPAVSNSTTSPSTAVTPTSTSTPSRLGSTQVPTTPITPLATSSPSPTTSTLSIPAATAAAAAANPTQPIQLRDLQSILATMNVPASSQGVDLASVLTPEVMAPILANPEVQQRLTPYLPSGESLPQSSEELHNTLSSPQFQQAMSMFSSALASGQLGPLMNQFGLPAEATTIIEYVKPSDLKKDMNETFKEKFPHIKLTLSKIRSLKREMRAVSEEFGLQPVTIAMAFVYFEKLVLQGCLNKQNRKLVAAACVLLAAKISSDLRKPEVKQLIDKLEERFRINRRELIPLEFPVLVALEMGLYLPESKVMPHYRRLVQQVPLKHSVSR
ncbi:hypothetical protein CCH79_00006507 [Gambusia affinis]|uniref:Uncharacterized protein n=1 Tax=Gambusia affinis TaxID=33528 RepID=A0A315W719_GAMAF|nr:hypothetical protein CCH79_00006507 [Gambusia affinis]